MLYMHIYIYIYIYNNNTYIHYFAALKAVFYKKKDKRVI